MRRTRNRFVENVPFTKGRKRFLDWHGECIQFFQIAFVFPSLGETRLRVLAAARNELTTSADLTTAENQALKKKSMPSKSPPSTTQKLILSTQD